MLPLGLNEVMIVVGVGFLSAMPVSWVSGYVTRLWLSSGLSLVPYGLLWLVGNPHPGIPWRIDVTLAFVAGGLCAAHLRSIWEELSLRLGRRKRVE